MFSRNLKTVIVLLVSVTAAFAASPRLEKTINRDWTFHYFPAEQPDLAPVASDYDDASWPAIALPHTWSTYETTGDRHLFIRSAAEKDDSYWWYGWGSYREQVERFIRDRNHGVDVFGADFRALIESMLKITTDRAGHLVADDYNFAVRALNEQLGKPAADKVKAAQDKARAKAEQAKKKQTRP